nr:near-infrared fluorescent protein BDFP1.8 [synthetic construct]
MANREVVETLKELLADGEKRVQVAGVIGTNAAEVVKTAVSLLFQEYPELVSPGGCAYTTRRYNKCVRDMNYFLRMCSYAIVAGGASVLDGRMLAGLRDTFNSLGIPLGPVARGIQLMKKIVKEKLATAGMTNIAFVDEPFDYIARVISETEI